MSTTDATTESPLERALAFMRLFAKDVRGRTASLSVTPYGIGIDIHRCDRSLPPPHALWEDIERAGTADTFPTATWTDGGIDWTAYPLEVSA